MSHHDWHTQLHSASLRNGTHVCIRVLSASHQVAFIHAVISSSSVQHTYLKWSSSSFASWVCLFLECHHHSHFNISYECTYVEQNRSLITLISWSYTADLFCMNGAGCVVWLSHVGCGLHATNVGTMCGDVPYCTAVCCAVLCCAALSYSCEQNTTRHVLSLILGLHGTSSKSDLSCSHVAFIAVRCCSNVANNMHHPWPMSTSPLSILQAGNSLSMKWVHSWAWNVPYYILHWLLEQRVARQYASYGLFMQHGQSWPVKAVNAV